MTRTKFRPDIEQVAARHGLDPNLVEAVVLTESSGNTRAYRFEPDFWKRYLADKPEWKFKDPERVSASYGLLQIMYPAAVELGYRGEPEALMVPATGLDWGCVKLRKLLAWSKGDIATALAAYNGGAGNNPLGGPLKNADYADRVLANLATIVPPAATQRV